MEKKNNRITIRLTESEMDQLKSKISAAGYKSTGAFIRDIVASGNVKAKVGTNIVIVARELVYLASLIKADKPKSELLEKVRLIASANAGGVL